MAADLRQVLEVLFAGLGLGPAPQHPTDAEEFDIEDARCVVARAPSGTEVKLTLDIGTLTRDPHVAADRLRQLLRLSLGLAMVNRAALVMPETPDDRALRALQAGTATAPSLRFQAVALINSPVRQDIFRALEDVVQLRTLALPYLTPDRRGAEDGIALFPLPTTERSASGRSDGDDTSSFLIFQP